MPKRIDANQRAMVAALRKVGASVQSLAAVGQGCPDLLVAFRGQWYVVEVKDGAKSPSRRRLTEAEADWHAEFSQRAIVHIWTTIDEALRDIGAML